MSTLPNTTNFGLHQWKGGPPGTGDPISRTELNENFSLLDDLARMVVCTSGTRPSSPYPGQEIYETDTRFTYVRNTANTLWVMTGGIPSVSSTSAITSPYTGQVIFLTTSNLLMRYTGSSWTPYSMFTHAQAATVSTAETTSSTSYTDLATVGPSVTLTSVGTLALIIFACKAFTNSASVVGHSCSVAVSGITTISASDAYAWQCTNDNSGFGDRGMSFVQLSITPGTNTFTLKYRNATAVLSTYQDRRIWVYAP
jgi:hypothetical protein